LSWLSRDTSLACVCVCVYVCVCVCVTLSCFILVVPLLKHAPRCWYLARDMGVSVYTKYTYLFVRYMCTHTLFTSSFISIANRIWFQIWKPRVGGGASSVIRCMCMYKRGETRVTCRPWHLNAQPVEADMKKYLRQTVCVQRCTATHCNTLQHTAAQSNTLQHWTKGAQKKINLEFSWEGCTQTDLKIIQIHESWIVLYSFFLFVFVFIRNHVTTRWISIGSFNFTTSTNKTASVKDVLCVYDMHMCMCMCMNTWIHTYTTLYIHVCTSTDIHCWQCRATVICTTASTTPVRIHSN